MDRATIVNHMLSVIGESGVSYVTSTHPSVQTANRILDTEDVDFQHTGWWFNTEIALTLTPSDRGEIIIPSNALDVRMSNVQNVGSSEKLRYARRGGKMYDSIKHTTVIDHSLVVDMVVQLPLISLPPVAASYLMHKAAESMFIDDDGDNQKANKLADRVQNAWTKLKAAELKALGPNALDNRFSQQLRMRSGQVRGNIIPGGTQ